MPKLDDISNEVKETSFDKVVKRFREKGFTQVNLPDEAKPKMLTNLADRNLKEIGNLMSNYAAYREYAEEEHSMAVQRYSLLKEEYDFAYAVKFNSLPGDKVTHKKTVVEADQALHFKRMKLLEEEMYMNLLGDKVESFNNCLAVISREIARREQTVGNKFSS